ncbi:MAG: ABC transporter substrate-binding protein [Desulfomicrobium sp.]|nr:ABC transporter substrate-binding protein [Desulfomicrobium sp.]
MLYRSGFFWLMGTLLALLVIPGIASAKEEIPHIRLNFSQSSNHTALIVALALEDKHINDGYYVKSLLPKERYELRKDDTPIAILDLIIGKSATETGTMYAQKHLDMALCSLTGIIVAVDKKTPVRIVSPLILASGGLFTHTDIPATNWDSFIEYAKQVKEPIRIGYHSPNSAPIIIFRGALEAEGIVFTYDPYDMDAQVVLVDLKGTQNLHPALVSKQVEGAVASDPNPQAAVFRGYANYIEPLRKMPPENKWAEYPCCVISASQSLIDSNSEVVQHVVNFINASAKWCTENQETAGVTLANWIGIDPEIGKMLRPVYLQSFTDSWKQGADGYLGELNKSNYFTGILKEKSFSEIEDILIDYRFTR